MSSCEQSITPQSGDVADGAARAETVVPNPVRMAIVMVAEQPRRAAFVM